MYKLRIRDLREDNNLYQRNLAEFLNVTQQTYSRYETEEFSLSLNSLVKIADYYDVSTDYLLGLTNKRKRSWKLKNR